MKKIAIIGFGVVGSGVYEIIRKNKDALTKKSGEEIDVKKILDIRDFSDHKESHLFTKDFNDLLNDGEIEIVVETMGGIKFAYEYTKALLESGKSVVTSNKELVATHGEEFFRIAKEKNVRYLYEASVGGGIPVIKKDDGVYEGVDAVIDKDFAAELLAEELALRDMNGEPLTRENFSALLERIDVYLSEFTKNGTENISVDLDE